MLMTHIQNIGLRADLAGVRDIRSPASFRALRGVLAGVAVVRFTVDFLKEATL